MQASGTGPQAAGQEHGEKWELSPWIYLGLRIPARFRRERLRLIRHLTVLDLVVPD